MAITPFTFSINKEIVFGFGTGIKKIEEIICKFRKVLIFTGGSSLEKKGYINKVKEYALIKGTNIFFEAIYSEPDIDTVNNLSEKYRQTGVEYIIAIGGGSVIDTAKAVSAMLTNNNNIEDFLEGVGTLKHNGVKIPLTAIPTTAGTGSEATKNAVISKIGADGYKRSLRHDNFIPDFAVLDAELLMGCPKNIIAASGMDAFTQLLEAYVSPKASLITDMYCEKGLELIIKNLENGYNGSTEAYEGLLLASYFSGAALVNAGLGIVHGFASSVGGYFNIPHGVICGTLLHESVKMNINAAKEIDDKETLNKYANCGFLFSPEKLCNEDAEIGLALLIENLERLTKKFEMPLLRNYGVSEMDIIKIVSETGNKNNCVNLSKEQITEILRKRI